MCTKNKHRGRSRRRYKFIKGVFLEFKQFYPRSYINGKNKQEN